MKLTEMLERLGAASEALEAAAMRLTERETAIAAEAEERVAHISATVASAREMELESRLEAAEASAREAEATVAELRAAGARKTSVTVAKGAGDGLGLGLGSIDAALGSLSIEQRFAVKAEMLRSGLIR